MVYFGYSAPANRRWQIAIALFGEQRVISAQLALAICLPRQRVASKELSRLDEFLLSASSTVKGWVGFFLQGVRECHAVHSIDEQHHYCQQGKRQDVMRSRFSRFSFRVDGLHVFLLE